MEPITSFLETGKLARKQLRQNLTVFPLLGLDDVSESTVHLLSSFYLTRSIKEV